MFSIWHIHVPTGVSAKAVPLAFPYHAYSTSKMPFSLKKKCNISTSLPCFYEQNYHFFFATMGLQEENGEKGQSVLLFALIIEASE